MQNQLSSNSEESTLSGMHQQFMDRILHAADAAGGLDVFTFTELSELIEREREAFNSTEVFDEDANII